MSAEQVARRDALSPTSPGLLAGASDYAQEVTALTRRWFIELIRERLNLVFSVLQPAIWLVFFGSGVERTIDRDVIGSNDYVAFMLPGVIVFTVVGNGTAGAMPLLWDKEVGYLARMMSMPIARSSVIVSRFVFQVIMQCAQVIAVLAVAYAMGVRIESGFAGVAVLLLAGSLLTMSVTALFCALAYAVPAHGTFFAVTGFVTLPLLFMSNAFVPLDAMPGWMEFFARINPLTYAIDAMRTLILEGWERDLMGSLAILCGFAVVCLVVGVDQFRRQTAGRIS